MDAVLDGGFAEPVLAAQSAFRAIIDALANPGTLQTLTAPEGEPQPLTPALAAVALTLCDHDTPVWLDATLRASGSVAEFLGFHCGAPLTNEPGRAAFAFAASAAELPPLAAFNVGTQDYPDRSTTIVLAVPTLTGGTPLVIRGPGIKDHGHIAPAGLPAGFVAQWAENRALFPRGIDLLLVSGSTVMGLPRSTRIEGDH